MYYFKAETCRRLASFCW